MSASVPLAAVLSSARACCDGGVVPGIFQFLQAGNLFCTHFRVDLEEALGLFFMGLEAVQAHDDALAFFDFPLDTYRRWPRSLSG